ncbi:hypothetical protein EKO27_g10693, partial [Xylaria grammica]
MSIPGNAVVAILLIFLFVGIGLVFWKGRNIIEHFAHVMFTAKQAQREQQEQQEQREQLPQRRRRDSSSEESVPSHFLEPYINKSTAAPLPTMAACPLLRAAVRTARNQPIASTCTSTSRCIPPTPRTFCTSTPALRPSTTTSSSASSPSAHDSSNAAGPRTTHFGFQDGLSESEKTERVAGVFHSVAETYDRMNDLMSFGWHRIWKDHFVSSLNPGYSSSIPPAPQRVLDVAGGTGDIAFRMLHQSHVVNANPNIHITISDINPSMLAVGKQRSLALPAAQQATLSF